MTSVLWCIAFVGKRIPQTAAAVQNENKLGKIFLHNNALRFVVYRFRWQKDTTNRRAKGQRAGDKLRTQLFLIVFKQ